MVNPVVQKYSSVSNALCAALIVRNTVRYYGEIFLANVFEIFTDHGYFVSANN